MLQKLLNVHMALQFVLLIVAPVFFADAKAQDNARVRNLFGRPGEGYIIPVQVGTPPQSVLNHQI